MAKNPYQRGLILIISAPSGCGKDTVAKLLLKQEAHLSLTVTTTSRPKREGEVEGVNYNFITRTEFEERITRGDFLEYNEFIGNLYGVPRGPVEERLSLGEDVIFVIDWNGARKLRAAMPQDIVSVFLLPPSLEELQDRLQLRGRESEEFIQSRLKQGKVDITHYDEYDYVVLNDDLDSVIRRFQHILRAERLRRYRQPWLGGFVTDLLAGKKPKAPTHTEVENSTLLKN